MSVWHTGPLFQNRLTHGEVSWDSMGLEDLSRPLFGVAVAVFVPSPVSLLAPSVEKRHMPLAINVTLRYINICTPRGQYERTCAF